ncbi:MAG: hypothetical protein V7K27_22960 [Nostoc sp.]|uniref:hypothetical protein n=1 Tax=Nostoc sp. TaxID=1180 RepID=UPI002FFC0C0B
MKIRRKNPTACGISPKYWGGWEGSVVRIDGVDSLLVDRTVTPPVFDQNQKVVIL